MDVNHRVAERLDEMARLLEEQGANRFRVAAYHHGAEAVRGLGRPLGDLVAEGGMDALDAVPGIGPRLARIIHDLVTTGRSPMLERLRGESDPVALLATVPGLGPTLAERVHERLGIGTLEALEAAAHDGRLGRVPGMGPRRLEAVRQSLAARLARARPRAPAGPAEPPVGELLEVDREYRREARGEHSGASPRAGSIPPGRRGCRCCIPPADPGSTPPSSPTPHSPTSSAAPTTGW